MALKANIVANFIGQGWRAIMLLAFVPLYIQLLGIESYGLIGLYATLQLWLTLLDLGIRPALGREMARHTAAPRDSQQVWDLLRSAEWFALGVAILVIVVMAASSAWLAAHWVNPQSLSVDTVVNALTLMGVVAGLQFIESIYSSALVGLQRQVLQNVIATVMVTLRTLGAVGVLYFASPTIAAYFVWQVVVSAVSVLIFALAMRRSLCPPPRGPRFSMAELHRIRGYAAGMMAITLLSLALTQVDKLLLSGQLTLSAFGLYMLAASVAGVLQTIGAPIGTAFLPLMTELVERRDPTALSHAFHRCAQAISVVVGSTGAMLVVFGQELLALWIQNPALAAQASPVLAPLVLGTLIITLLNVPYALQLAHGWTSLLIAILVILIGIFVPVLIIVVPRFGGLGAAYCWLGMAIINFAANAIFMFRRILPRERFRWLVEDTGLPILVAFLIAAATSWLLGVPDDAGPLLAVLILLGMAVLVAAALSAPLAREMMIRAIRLPRHESEEADSA